MSYIKNIIFDLNGVLFEYDVTSTVNLNQFDNQLKIKTIKSGVEILKNCYKNAFEENSSYKFYICTNWGTSVINYLKRDFSDIINLFHGIVNSSQACAKKPDFKIFLYLMQKYQLKPEECLFIDDQEKNIESASYLGMTGIHVKDFDYVNKILKKLNVIK